MSRLVTALCMFALFACPRKDSSAADLDPKLTSASGVKMTLVAEHPVVMTPTGIDVDQSGGCLLYTSDAADE